MKPLRISIVTPSFNQAPYLEQTIRSVLDQLEPGDEYRVLDGGSTDGSAKIIERYAARLAGWRSERDGGQADAIRRGFAESTGDILAYLNSDDYYLPGALASARRAFAEDLDLDLLYGDIVFVSPTGDPLVIDVLPEFSWEDLRRVCVIPQPAAFWRARSYHRVEGINPAFDFAMDYDLFLRLAELGKVRHIPHMLAAFRYHSEGKTSRARNRWMEEDRILHRRSLGRDELDGSDRWRLRWLTARQMACIAARRLRGEKFPCLTPARWHRAARRKLEGW